MITLLAKFAYGALLALVWVIGLLLLLRLNYANSTRRLLASFFVWAAFIGLAAFAVFQLV